MGQTSSTFTAAPTEPLLASVGEHGGGGHAESLAVRRAYAASSHVLRDVGPTGRVVRPCASQSRAAFQVTH